MIISMYMASSSFDHRAKQGLRFLEKKAQRGACALAKCMHARTHAHSSRRRLNHWQHRAALLLFFVDTER